MSGAGTDEQALRPLIEECCLGVVGDFRCKRTPPCRGTQGTADCFWHPSNHERASEPDQDEDEMVECECGADVDTSIFGDCHACGKPVL